MTPTLDANPENSPSRLDGIPVEVHILILSHLDPDSLKAVSLTSHLLLNILEGSISQLFTWVLSGIPERCWTDAIWCIEGMRLEKGSSKAIRKFLDHYDSLITARDLLNSLCLRRTDLFKFLNMQPTLKYWHSRISEHMSTFAHHLPGQEQLFGPLDSRGLTRLEGALYRHHLTCLLFDSTNPTDIPRAKLLCKWHVVLREENESILAFFDWYFKEDFQASIEHDIERAQHFLILRDAHSFSYYFGQYDNITLQGLKSLRHYDQQETTRERAACFILTRGAVRGLPRRGPHRWNLEDPVIQMDDQDAIKSWQTLEPILAVHPQVERFFRTWGCIFRESSEFEHLRVHDAQTLTSICIEWLDRDFFENRYRIFDTLDERHCIYARGGRGWYVKGGESHIRWESGSSDMHYLPGEEPEGFVGPQVKDFRPALWSLNLPPRIDSRLCTWREEYISP